MGRECGTLYRPEPLKNSVSLYHHRSAGPQQSLSVSHIPIAGPQTLLGPQNCAFPLGKVTLAALQASSEPS